MMGIGAVALSFLTPAYGQVSVGPWEIHQGGGAIVMATPNLVLQKKALDVAKIPTQNDPGWKGSPGTTVDVDVPSVLQGQNQQVDYMFFQVVVNIPKGTKVDKFQVKFDQVDDAARVSIFNNQNPNGKFYPDADVIGKKSNLTVKSDFKNDVVEGENRVVITQYDWAPSGNHIKGIHILVNGSEVPPTNVFQVGPIEVDLGGAKMKMSALPKATFWMGGGADNAPVKEVQVGEFCIGVTEVTQAQWKAVMGNNNPSKFKGDNFPVETVSWNDVQKFIVALNQKTKGTGYVYRLPTEMEWEYACRGGATSKADCSFDFYFDQPTNNLSTAEANFDGAYPRGNAIPTKSLGTTVNVGSYKPNKLGLYDMHGNVWEWTDTLEGSGRVLRGAHWGDRGQSCKASARLKNVPGDKNENLGFRIAASVSNVQTKSDAMEIPKGGDAKQSTVDAGEYILTEDKMQQHGGFWAKQPISFKNSFTISAEIYLGNKGDSSGADGIALVFQDKGVVSVPTGAGIGYAGMTPSIAIEFDTYQNVDANDQDLNDPVKNHVALCMNGDPKHAKDAVTKGDVKEIDNNLEDGKYHPITIEWDAVKKTFTLTLDGKPVFKDKTIPAHTMADNTISYGFTSATGGRSNEHKVRAISYTKR